MKKQKTQLPDISKEFLDKEKMYSVIKKVGGRYTSEQRHKRRDEVYRLHFEYNYPATKIASMMKVNRHTITDDIKYWNEKLSSEWDKIDVHARCMKQLQSLELQKNRLTELIKNADKVSEKISAERLILEIDEKITRIITNANKTDEKIRVGSLEMLNKWAAKNNIEHKFIDQQSLLKVTQEQWDKIQKVLSDGY